MGLRKTFLLQIDPSLWKEIEAWAQQELRSVNGQIEFLLRQAVQKRRGNKDKNRPSGKVKESQNSPKQENM